MQSALLTAGAPPRAVKRSRESGKRVNCSLHRATESPLARAAVPHVPTVGIRSSARLVAARNAVDERVVPTEVLVLEVVPGEWSDIPVDTGDGGDGGIGAGGGGMGGGGNGDFSGGGGESEGNEPVAALNLVVAFCCLSVGLTASSSIMRVAGVPNSRFAPALQHHPA